MSLDDPKFISPIVDVPLTATYLLMMGIPGALLLCLLIVLAFVAQGVSRNGVRPVKAGAQLLVSREEMKAAWERGEKNRFYPYGKSYAQVLSGQE